MNIESRIADAIHEQKLAEVATSILSSEFELLNDDDKNLVQSAHTACENGYQQQDMERLEHRQGEVAIHKSQNQALNRETDQDPFNGHCGVEGQGGKHQGCTQKHLHDAVIFRTVALCDCRKCGHNDCEDCAIP